MLRTIKEVKDVLQHMSVPADLKPAVDRLIEILELSSIKEREGKADELSYYGFRNSVEPTFCRITGRSVEKVKTIEEEEKKERVKVDVEEGLYLEQFVAIRDEVASVIGNESNEVIFLSERSFWELGDRLDAKISRLSEDYEADKSKFSRAHEDYKSGVSDDYKVSGYKEKTKWLPVRSRMVKKVTSVIEDLKLQHSKLSDELDSIRMELYEHLQRNKDEDTSTNKTLHEALIFLAFYKPLNKEAIQARADSSYPLSNGNWGGLFKLLMYTNKNVEPLKNPDDLLSLINNGKLKNPTSGDKFSQYDAELIYAMIKNNYMDEVEDFISNRLPGAAEKRHSFFQQGAETTEPVQAKPELDTSIVVEAFKDYIPTAKMFQKLLASTGEEMDVDEIEDLFSQEDLLRANLSNRIGFDKVDKIFSKNGIEAIKNGLMTSGQIIKDPAITILLSDNGMTTMNEHLISPGQASGINRYVLETALSDRGLEALRIGKQDPQNGCTVENLSSISGEKIFYVSTVFSENGLNALRSGVITFKDCMDMPSDLHVEQLVSPHAIQALNKKIISKDEIKSAKDVKHFEVLFSNEGIDSLKLGKQVKDKKSGKSIFTVEDALSMRTPEHLRSFITKDGVDAMHNGYITKKDLSKIKRHETLDLLLSPNGLKAMKHHLIQVSRFYLPEDYLTLADLLSDNGIAAMTEKLIKVSELYIKKSPRKVSGLNQKSPLLAKIKYLLTDYGIKALRNGHKKTEVFKITVKEAKKMRRDNLKALLSKEGEKALETKLLTHDEIKAIDSHGNYLECLLTERGLSLLGSNFIEVSEITKLPHVDYLKVIMTDTFQKQDLIKASDVHTFKSDNHIEFLVAEKGRDALQKELITVEKASKIEHSITLKYLLNSESGLQAYKDGSITSKDLNKIGGNKTKFDRLLERKGIESEVTPTPSKGFGR